MVGIWLNSKVLKAFSLSPNTHDTIPRVLWWNLTHTDYHNVLFSIMLPEGPPTMVQLDETRHHASCSW